MLQRRAASVGKAYSRLADSVQTRLREASLKPGVGRIDPCQIAKVQYELGALVARRDRVEARFYAWQRLAEKASRWVNTLSTWKGKKLPYTLGAVDLWLALSAIDTVGVSEYVSARRVYELIAGWFTS